MNAFFRKIILAGFVLLVFSTMAAAQATEFTYQGKLNDGAVAANANYDFEFRLYDAANGGTQIGTVNARNTVAVAGGIFSVNLDFGQGFPGPDRFLEISVRITGGGGFTILAPRQKVASSPYAVQSLNAANATNAVNANSAVNFSGALSGDVTGTQSATAVTRLQGRDVSGTAPLGGQVLKFNSATNQWIPDTDNVGSGGGGTITAVTPGTGLSGGGATGNVTIGIANGGVGTTQIADGSVTDAKIISVSGAKVTGTVANATAAATAATATTALNFSNPLAGDVTGNQGATTVQRIRNLPIPAPVQADDGKVLRYKNDGVNPAAFELATVTGGGSGTITGVTAGTGLTGGGTTGTVTVGIAPGGVGTNEIANNAVTDARIAPSTITAPKIAGGQVVKSLNSLSDAVTLTAGSNITITPAGNTLTIASTSGGVGGSGTTNRIPLWSGAGTTIGDSLITQAGGTVQLPTFVSLANTASGNGIGFGNPNSETGMTISGASGRADLRYDGTLKLVNGPGGIPPATNGIAITTAGNVGIGTTNPTTKLYVLTGVAGTSAITGESASGPGVYGVSQSSRGVFGQSTSGRGVFGQSGSGEGVLGVSTSSAGVSGGSTSGSGVYGESPVSSLTAAGVYGKGTGSGSIGVIGESNIANAVGVFGVSTSPGGVGVYARNFSGGRAIFAEGNVAQSLSSNGLIKAMISVDSGGSINSCYNGITNSSSGNCGFIITRPLGDVGIYRINFSFPITGRFISVTAQYGSNCFMSPCSNNHGANYRDFDDTSMEVFTFFSDSKDTFRHTFMLIMY